MIYLEGEPRNTGMGARIPGVQSPWGLRAGESSAHSGPRWQGCSLVCTPHEDSRFAASKEGWARSETLDQETHAAQLRAQCVCSTVSRVPHVVPIPLPPSGLGLCMPDGLATPV